MGGKLWKIGLWKWEGIGLWRELRRVRKMARYVVYPHHLISSTLIALELTFILCSRNPSVEFRLGGFEGRLEVCLVAEQGDVVRTLLG